MKKSNLLLIIIFALITVIGLLFPSCKAQEQAVTPYWYSGESDIKQRSEIPDSTWNRFLECSENEGDAGCDSCWQAIVQTDSLVYWIDSVKNPYNHEWIVETAFNNDVSYDAVTQKMFNERYGIRYKK